MRVSPQGRAPQRSMLQRSSGNITIAALASEKLPRADRYHRRSRIERMLSMSDVTLGNRLDRPVDDKSDHILKTPRTPPSRSSNTAATHAPIAVRLTSGSPRCAISSATACAMCSAIGRSLGSKGLPDAPPNWSSAPLIEALLGRTPQADDALRRPDRGRPRNAVAHDLGVSRGSRPERTIQRLSGRRRAGRRGRGQRRGERGDHHPDLLHQWPPLRRAMG